MIARALLVVPFCFVVAQDPVAPSVPRDFAQRDLHGFEIRLVNDFDKHELHAKVMALLDNQLYRIARVVDEPALARLRKIPVWVGFEDARHAKKCMFYHPSPRWLAEHEFPTELAGGIEVANAENFLKWTLDQPWMVLHELAHGYHHQVLGHGHTGLRTAFAAAKKQGGYEKVQRISGAEVEHYALTDVQEYFAEASEAYFGTNDFYPFVRSELRAHDPRGYAVLEQVWGKRRR